MNARRTPFFFFALLFLLLLNCKNASKAYGQDYVPLLDTNKVWNIFENMIYWGETHRHYLKVCDTDSTRFVFIKEWHSAWTEPLGYLHEDTLSRKVFYIDYTGNEILLYDFSLVEGDVFQTTLDDVLIVDSVQLKDGTFRKRIVLGYYDVHLFSWIEGIGSHFGGLLWTDWRFKNKHIPEAHLLCYFENDSLLYRNDGYFISYDGCNYSFTDVNTETIKSLIPRIYPNPARDELNISLPDNFQNCHTISILDLSGRLLLQEVHCGNEFRLNVRNLKPGLYFLQVINQKGVLGHKFLIK
jgi:hypothetical protein